MLAHKKLWESALNPEGIPTTFPWICDKITSMLEFRIMENDKWENDEDSKPEDVLLWQLFFSLYFADECFQTDPHGMDNYIEV